MSLTLPDESRELDLFCIGNPLIDLVYTISNEDLSALGLDGGIMHLVDEQRRESILSYLDGREPAVIPGGSAPNTVVALVNPDQTPIRSSSTVFTD